MPSLEEVRSRCSVLKESLALAGFADRIRTTDNLNTLLGGEATIINGDFRDYAEHILDFTKRKRDYRFAFYFLDPYGPKAIPLTTVAPIISQKRHDVMINFPYQDLHKKAGMILKKKLRPVDRQLVHYHTLMFGSNAWIGLVRQIAASAHTGERYTDEMEQELVNLYQEVLTNVDDQLAVKSIRLRFPDKERTMFYLFLTTHDPNGALALNEILWEARLAEHELRWEFRFAKEIAKYRKKGQLSLFDPFDNGFLTPSPDMPPRPDIDVELIAGDILQTFHSGQVVKFVDILRALADSPYYFGEIKKAMTRLKRKKRVTYSPRLANNSRVIFN